MEETTTTKRTATPLLPWISSRDLIIAAVAMAVLGAGSFLVSSAHGEGGVLDSLEDEMVRMAVAAVAGIVAAAVAWGLFRWADMPRGQMLPFILVVFIATAILPAFSDSAIYTSLTVDALQRFSTWGVLAYVVYVLAAGDGGIKQAVENLRLTLPDHPKEYGFAILIFIGYYAVFLAWVIGTNAIGVPSWLELPDNTSSTVEGSGVVVAAILTIVLNPITEEFVFRGFAMTGLLVWFGAGRWGLLGAAFVSSIIFALAHVNPEIGFGIVPATLISGMGFALIYWRTKSLVLAIVIHMMANSIPFLTQGLA